MASLLFNQIKHDIARLRLLVVAFVAVNALKAIFILGYTLYPEKTVPYVWHEIEGQIAFITLLNYFLGSLIAATFVYQDSLCDGDAFWLSRPISPGTMFASKLIGISAVCIGLPALTDIAIGLFHDFGFRSLIGIIPGIEVALLVYIPIVFIASITKSLSRLIAIITLLGFGLGCLLFVSDSVFDFTADYEATGYWKPILIFTALLGFVAGTLNQYLRRDLSSTLIISVSTLAVVLILPFFSLPELSSKPVFPTSEISPDRVTFLSKFNTESKDKEPESFQKLSISGIPEDRVCILFPKDEIIDLEDPTYLLGLTYQDIAHIVRHLSIDDSISAEVESKDSFSISINQQDAATHPGEFLLFEFSINPAGNLPATLGETLISENRRSIIHNRTIHQQNDDSNLMELGLTEITSASYKNSITGIPFPQSSKQFCRVYKSESEEFDQAFKFNSYLFGRSQSSPILPINIHAAYPAFDLGDSEVQELSSLEVFDIELQNTYTLKLDNF